MKKIFLALAAVAALASCVKENTLVPEQTADNLVTITAVSAGTKTVLNGADVVWENTDKIKVILDYAEDELQDFTISSLSGSTASFTGTFAKEVTADYAYAVYPNSAVVVDGGVTKILHTLSADQSAGITSGMNLSFADLDKDALAAGNATATFRNPLALVKVIIPEGVKSVSLTSSRDALVGDAVYQLSPTYGIYRTVSPSGKTVSLTKAEGLPTDNSILVYPGNAGNLTLTMVGLDGTTYTKTTANEIYFTASEYRTINLANLFNMDVADVKTVSPMGETFTFDIVAAEQYDYKVAIEDDPAWITLNANAHVTKAFVGTKVSFTVDANTTGSPREANVTITWNDGEEQSRSFKVTQASAYLDFVYVDGNPANDLIQWEETFSFYGSVENANSAANALASYTNVFTISLAEGDELTYGTYKIENMLKAYFYYGEGYQHMSDVGGVYYANYDAVNKKLTVSMTGATMSYNNMSDITLIYNDVNKTFSAETFAATAVQLPDNQNPISGYIGGYTVTVKEEVNNDDPIAVLTNNTYKESYTLGNAWGNTPGNLTFVVSDNPEKGQVKITRIFGNEATNMYAKVSGNTITTDASAYINNLMGTNAIGVLTLTIDGDGNITIPDQRLYDYYSLSNYKATKQ